MEMVDFSKCQLSIDEGIRIVSLELAINLSPVNGNTKKILSTAVEFENYIKTGNTPSVPTTVTPIDGVL